MASFYQHEAIDTLEEWPRNRRSSFENSPFETRFSETLNLLEREIRYLNPRQSSVRIKSYHRPYDIRQDGMLRSGEVRAPIYPGIILEFDSYDERQKKYIKIQFICDKFKGWKDNVRAIALGMEALRKVERYGITSAQEQYEGFKAKSLPPRVELGASMTPADALAFIQHKAQKSAVATRENYDDLFRHAASNCHPDRGGTHDDMAKLNIARETLRAHYSKI